MGWVRARKLKTGVHYYAIDGGRSRALGPDYVPSPTPGTLAYMAERDQLLNPEPTRRKVWRRILARLGGNTKARAVTRDRIEDYRAQRLREGVSPATVNKETAMISAGFRDQEDFNPCAGIKRLKESPKKGTALAPDDIARLLYLLRQLHEPTALLAEFLYLTGSRFSERGVVEGGWLRFPPSKGGLARAFPLEGRLAEIIGSLSGGTVNSAKWSRRYWDEAVTLFGRHVTPKDLRHSAVTNLLEEGGSIPDAQRMTGHTTPQMIHQTYAHLRPVAARGPKSPALPLDPENSGGECQAANDGEGVPIADQIERTECPRDSKSPGLTAVRVRLPPPAPHCKCSCSCVVGIAEVASHSMRKTHSRALGSPGQRFGMWVILASGSPNPRGRAMFLCRCDCGTEREVLWNNLQKGESRSCGCMKRENRGPKHHRWKGGRHVTERGYVQLRSADGIAMPDGSVRRYVDEHVLIMANKLGRPLLPGESVHHINGVKSDNRPENLELWVQGQQPPGQRASDLVAWAEKVLERYRDSSSSYDLP